MTRFLFCPASPVGSFGYLAIASLWSESCCKEFTLFLLVLVSFTAMSSHCNPRFLLLFALPVV